MQLVSPRSVVDVGCGNGAWLAEFLTYGVQKVLGVDKDVALDDLLFPSDRFERIDLSRPFQISGSFDLVICLEVAEHLPPECAESFVDVLVTAGPIVLFSAAVPYQGGTHHVNEQWPDYWEMLFARRGFVAIDCLRALFWANPNVAWWYSQNAIMYVREDNVRAYPSLREFSEARPLRLVHPYNYLAHADPGKQGVRVLSRALAGAFRDALMRRLRVNGK
jgi:SAM-dependent methyltransferase